MNPTVNRPASGAERARKFRAKNPGKDKKNKLKNNINETKKRLIDESYDLKVKESARRRTQKSRAEKKRKLEMESTAASTSKTTQPDSSSSSSVWAAAQLNPDTTSSTSSRAIQNIITKSRQGALGLKIRKQNNDCKNETIEELVVQVSELKKQLHDNEEENFDLHLQVAELTNKVLKKDQSIESLASDLKTSDHWLKLTYQKMSPVGKREFKTALNLSIPDFSKGTITRLRNATGINFSNPLPVDKSVASELKEAIEKFAVENSCDVPDMRKEKKSIRYYYNYLICLHATFLQEHPLREVSYAVFCSYWPKNIIKPRIEDFGTCRCETCENVELKLSALKKRGLINSSHDIQSIIKANREGDYDLEIELLADISSLLEEDKRELRISFLQWEKVEKPNLNPNTGEKNKKIMNRVPKTAEAKDLSLLTKRDFEKVKEHLNRSFAIKNTIKQKRLEVLENDKMAMLQVDWAENGQVIVPGEVQSAFYGGRLSYNLHTGYQYTKDNAGGFVSLSDFNNHKGIF